MTAVTGSATVGGVSFSVSAPLTLPGVTPPPPPPPPGASQAYFGLWDDSFNAGTSISGAAAFSAAPLKSMTFYVGWGTPFPAELNSLINAAGATLYLNMEPWNTYGGGANPAMTDIAAGKYDQWLAATIGGGIKAGGRPVLLTFAHEMNGNGWYPWQQSGGVSPAQWIAGWNHVVATVKAAAGGLASFVWCPNNVDVGPCAPYWPGTADVVGMDAYLNQPGTGQTYATFVKQTVDAIGKLDGIGSLAGQVWNAETGVTGSNRSARISQFVGDMHSDGRVSGLTWFHEGEFVLQPAEISALCAAVNAWNAA